MKHKDFVHDRVEKFKIFSHGQPMGKNTDKGYRAYTIVETSNALQRELQWTDLNMRCKLISCLPHPVFIFRMGSCGFISRQSALIAWHNAFNHENNENYPLKTIQHTLLDATQFLQSVFPPKRVA